MQRLRGVRGAPESPTARNQGGGRVTCSGGSGEIPGELRTGVEGCGLGKIPGHGAELLRGSCEAGARQSVVVAAAQATLRGGATRAWLARVWVAALEDGKVQGAAVGVV